MGIITVRYFIYGIIMNCHFSSHRAQNVPEQRQTKFHTYTYKFCVIYCPQNEFALWNVFIQKLFTRQEWSWILYSRVMHFIMQFLYGLLILYVKANYQYPSKKYDLIFNMITLMFCPGYMYKCSISITFLFDVFDSYPHSLYLLVCSFI